MNTSIAPETVTFERDIAVPVARVFQMFVNRDDASDWLGYDAHIYTEAENGFALYIRRDGTHIYGDITALEDNKCLTMTWQTGAESGVSCLNVDFEALDDSNTRLILTHSDLKDADDVRHYSETWEQRLNNLKRLLETGERADIADRIIIGIMPQGLNDDTIKRLNLPVDDGVLVQRLVPGYSAEAAGMQVDDVIVEVNDVAVHADNSAETIYDAVRDLKPGDTVTVKYYRGADLHTVDVALKGYPVPDIPENFAALADRWEAEYQEIYDALDTTLTDVSEAVASAKPDADTRSIKEILAHMILRQTHTMEWLSTYIEPPRRINPYTNNPARIKSLITVYPTLADLLTEFRRKQAQTLVVLREFPDTLERPDYHWWIVFEVAFLPDLFRDQLNIMRDRLKVTASQSA